MGTARDRTFGSRNGAGITRREALKSILLSAAGLALLDPWKVLSAAPATHRVPQGPRAPRKAAAQAKSVIQIWMWGGPCHIDTFDPKPDAGRDYCGPLNTAIPTNVEDITINGSLPLLAKQADKYSIIRSMTHGVNAHETASYIVQTGREPGRQVFPSAGAVTSLFKG